MMSEFWDLLVESHWIAVQFVSRTCQPPKDDTDTESDERRPQCEETTCVFRLKWIKRRKDTNTLCYDINSRLPTSEESLVLLPALSTASKFVRFVRRLSTDFWGVLDWSSWTKSALIQTFSCSNQQKMQLYVLSITSNFSEHKKKKKTSTDSFHVPLKHTDVIWGLTEDRPLSLHSIQTWGRADKLILWYNYCIPESKGNKP